MTLTRPNTSVAVWGMHPWRWGRAVSQYLMVQHHQCTYAKLRHSHTSTLTADN